MKIVIVGGGWAGCSAAVQAAKMGAETILLERADMLLGDRPWWAAIMRNNGRFTAAEELISPGRGRNLRGHRCQLPAREHHLPRTRARLALQRGHHGARHPPAGGKGRGWTSACRPEWWTPRLKDGAIKGGIGQGQGFRRDGAHRRRRVRGGHRHRHRRRARQLQQVRQRLRHVRFCAATPSAAGSAWPKRRA